MDSRAPGLRAIALTALAILLSAALPAPGLAEIRVPAFTAYLEPRVDGARVSERTGISRWTDPSVRVLWFGELKCPGALEASLVLRLPEGQISKLRLTAAGRTAEASVTGKGSEPVTIPFGSFEVNAPGWQRFVLESANEAGKPAGDLQALVLDGPATRDAAFNLKPRRNAASVHLAYQIPREAKVDAFYCEVTAVDDPLWTFYMACGWHRGYFGMQVNDPGERRIIFSVWDSGSESTDRSKVAAEDRVTLVAKGEAVVAGDFGNEGTGGHSHRVYAWKTGQVQRFLVTSKPAGGTHTIYAGHYFHPEEKRWVLISAWKAPKEKDGGWLRGLHSFSENFVGSNGHLRRKALYGNQWFRTSGGAWTEVTEATFSHDPTGKADRLDRFMGVEDGRFFLSHGGFVPGSTKFGEPFKRPATGKVPSDLDLPELPAPAVGTPR